ncbi:MAG: hypothetical protein LH615_13340 [Ferruginibacter sp.]|nr:hypothetical protein [Ferruginibacter sp.]
MKTTNFYKYFFNFFILTIPILIWNILLTNKLPETTKPEILLQNISPFLIYGENIIRVTVFALMVFMPIQISKKIQKQGLLLFLFGTLLYFASWLVLIYYPDSLWSKSTFGVLSPAYTPLLWLIGIGLIGDSFYFNLPYNRWIFISLSIVFLVFHNIHTYKIYF